MTKVVINGGQTEPICRPLVLTCSETGLSLGALRVGASRLELLTPCL